MGDEEKRGDNRVGGERRERGVRSSEVGGGGALPALTSTGTASLPMFSIPCIFFFPHSSSLPSLSPLPPPLAEL